MTPELNREYVAPGEEALFEEAARITFRNMEQIGGRFYRGVHAKATGVVKATFQIGNDVPENLRHGVFREPGRTFDAIARFSNAAETLVPDNKETVRGLAIKLLDVAGDRAIPDDPDRTQDFLMVDHPVFPFPGPRSYLRFLRLKNFPLIGKLLLGANLTIFEREPLTILKSAARNQVASPLEDTYWSGAPIWLGDADGNTGHAIKYSAVPREVTSVPPPPEQRTADYLSEALIRHLREKEAVFDFKVQLQTDAVAMPVENVSVEWDEQVSPPITVATLRIASQAVGPETELARQCEAMSFTTWHALREHRPLGGTNRLRKAVYQASYRRRSEQ